MSIEENVNTPIQDLNEFVGKVISRFTLSDDESLGREVAIHFEDGSRVSIAFRSVVVREAKHVDANGETVRQYPDPPASEWVEFRDTGVDR